MTEAEFPRRSNLERMSPAELAIFQAIQHVELVGADVRLTNAVTLLSEARAFVADYVDGVDGRLTPAQEATRTERKRCVGFVNWARVNGETDLRSVRAGIESGQQPGED